MQYDSYREWKDWSAQAFGEVSRADGAYFAAELARCGVTNLARVTVLEIGFGNGAFASWATQRGAIYKGVEVISELVQRGREKGFDVYSADVPLDTCVEQGALDIAVAFDVFEHLDQADLSAMLTKVYNALKSGGALIARVPSGDSPFAGAIQHGDFTHRLIIGSSAVRQLASSVGYLVEQVREPAFPIHGGGLKSSARRAAVRLARSLAYPIVTNLFMGGGSPVLSPTMLFVLRKPQEAFGQES